MPRTTPIKNKSANLSEIGSSGLRIFGGQISEEQLRQLSGLKGSKVYAEMADNDSTVGAIIFVIDKLLRNVDWEVKPVDASPAAEDAADFVKSCKDDMEHSWSDFISEALSMLVFGFAPHGIVYKIRAGEDFTDSRYFSK